MDELLKREVQRLNGMFYGMLTDEEREIVDEAVKRGLARQDYGGVGGLLGLSKVCAV